MKTKKMIKKCGVIDISRIMKKVKKKRIKRKITVRDSSQMDTRQRRHAGYAATRKLKAPGELKSHDPFLVRSPPYKCGEPAGSPLREKRQKRIVQSIRVDKGINWYFFKADMDVLSLLFMLIFCTSLTPMLVNITEVDEIGLPVILLFIIQGVGSYALTRYIGVPIFNKRSILKEGLVFKAFILILLIGFLMIFTGLYYRDSIFIKTVSLPLFFLSGMCLVGGVGIGINKSLFSVITFSFAILLLMGNAVMGIQKYSILNSIIFALSGLVYLELSSAADRLKNIEGRITMKPPESEGQTLVDYKIDFLRGFLKTFSKSSAILGILLLFPVLFRLITMAFALEGYALRLTESVEMGTVYIYLLPSAIAVMLLVIYRMMRYATRTASYDDTVEKIPEVEYSSFRI